MSLAPYVAPPKADPMTFKSAQVEYSGQQGWNDLTPDALVTPGVRRARSRPRRVYTPAGAPPPSGASMPPPMPPAARSMESLESGPPRSRRSSLAPSESDASLSSLSSLGAVGAKGVVPPTPLPPAASLADAARDDQPHVDGAVSALAALCARPSALAPAQKEASQRKLEQLLPTLSAPQVQFVLDVLAVAQQPGGRASARETLVVYAQQHSHVSAWVAPLRRLVEQSRDE